MTIECRVLGAHEDEAYCAFLNRLGGDSPSVLAYHYPFYRDMLVGVGIGEPMYLAALRDGEMAGVLPGFLRTGNDGTVYCSLPFFGPNAGVLCAGGPKAGETHRALFDAVKTILHERGDVLSAAFYTPFLNDDYSCYDAAFPEALVVEKFTHYLDTDRFSIPGHIAYDIRKAQRLGVTVSTGVTPERIEEFYTLYAMNCVDYGIPQKPRETVDFLACEREHVRCYFAHHEDRMIAGLMVLDSPRTTSYYMPCALHSARTFQAPTLLIGRAIQDSREAGRNYWNWESSPGPESGVALFKRKWGGEMGAYRVYVVPFAAPSFFQGLGREKIAAEFPHYFVYPFDRL